jgi:tetratricopeptide (TPR) repeat protein
MNTGPAMPKRPNDNILQRRRHLRTRLLGTSAHQGRPGGFWRYAPFALLMLNPNLSLAENPAHEAPLDTLYTPDPVAPWAAAEKKLEISRKVLPDVQATSIPRDAAPKSPPRLDDPKEGAYQFHLAQQALLSGNLNLAADKVMTAESLDPHQPRYCWWQSGMALRLRDPGGLMINLPSAIGATWSDPLERFRVLILAHQAALVYIALLWSLIIVASLCRCWPVICHDLAAGLFRSRRHFIRPWLGMIPLVTILLLRPGWLGYLALISIPLFLHGRTKDRWLLGTIWIISIGLTYPAWSPLRQALPACDPRSETNLLAQASRLPHDPEIVARLQKALTEASDPVRRQRLTLALGVQLARQGDYTASNEQFRRVLDDNPRHVGGRVDLANNTYYLGHFDAAMAEYKTAQKLAPGQPAIPYNLAQIYFKKLFLPEAEEALKRSRELGFDPQAWEDPTGEANGFSPVVYLGMSAEELSASARFEAPLYPVQAHLEAWRNWLGCPPAPLYIILLGAFLWASVLAYRQSRLEHPRTCRNCGWAICTTCGRARDGHWLCAVCGETADKAKSELVRATLLKNRSRSLELARQARTRQFGRLLPGGGHLVAGRVFAGLLRLALLAGALFLILFGWSFDLTKSWDGPALILPGEAIHPTWVPLPRAAWPGLFNVPLLVGLALLGLSYIWAQINVGDLRNRSPERPQFAELVKDHRRPQPPAFRRAP